MSAETILAFREIAREKQPFLDFLNRNPPAGMPPLSVDKIALKCLTQEERKKFSIALDGSFSLTLFYKAKAGAFLDLDTLEKEEVLKICELKGARSLKSYRLASGMLYPEFFADRLNYFTDRDPPNLRRIIMPPISVISVDSELAYARYEKLADLVGLYFSKEEQHFVRDL